MSFLRAARAARFDRMGPCRVVAALAIVLITALLTVSCGSNTVARNHSAYVSLPDDGSVLLVQVNSTTGALTQLAETPQVQGTSPTGLALLPSKKFLYAANSRANTISIFSVNSDGTLSLTGTPMPAGNGPNVAVIDPTGQYLLVTNNFSNDISVFQIDVTTGGLTQVGSTVPANANPTDIVFTHSGQFVYVTNPGIGMVSIFSFANGVLTQLPGLSPVFSGKGASALVVDNSDSFLYVANVTAINPAPNLSTGNISGFNIDSTSGALTLIQGSPFMSADGNGPSALAIDPAGQLVYAFTPGSSFSIWSFTINYASGTTNGSLVATTSSPFSLSAGGIFALFDPSGDYLFVGSNTGIAAYTYNQSSGSPSAVTGSPFALGTAPGKMVFLN
ncbi:MAG: beta-propeller fold lactonase family protein [Terriglobales bacterium]